MGRRDMVDKLRLRSEKTYITIILVAIAVIAFLVYNLIMPSTINPHDAPICKSHTLPYTRAELNGEPYKVTIFNEGCHTEDIVVAGWWGDKRYVFEISPRGELINSFEVDWHNDHVRLTSDGNYLMCDHMNRIIETNLHGDIVWELDIPGVHHQVVPLENGNLLICRYDGFVEVSRSGEVMFEWEAEDYISEYSPANFRGLEIIEESATFYNPLALTRDSDDWAHLNFAQKLPSGNYIASLRNLDLILEVNGENGMIVWSYGPGIIKHQHTPIVYGNYMYIYDNGNGRIIKLDMNTSRIVLTIEGLLAPVFGDVRRLPNGNLLITDSFHNRAIEVNEDTGRIVWEIQFDFAPYRVWAEGTW